MKHICKRRVIEPRNKKPQKFQNPKSDANNKISEVFFHYEEIFRSPGIRLMQKYQF